MKDNNSILLIIFFCLIILLGMFFLRKPEEQKKIENKEMQNTLTNDTAPTPSTTPAMQGAKETATAEVKKVNYNVTIKTTAGDVTLLLNGKDTPITVANFVKLAKSGFYSGTVFHRVIKGFMIQGGDPTGTGSGGPGYKFDDEPFTGEYTRGTIAMANSGPNTNGSQFFIMHQDYGLPKNYVIFGNVTQGLGTLDAIAEAPVTTSAMGESSKPVTPVKIISVDVTEVTE